MVYKIIISPIWFSLSSTVDTEAESFLAFFLGVGVVVRKNEQTLNQNVLDAVQYAPWV